MRNGVLNTDFFDIKPLELVEPKTQTLMNEVILESSIRKNKDFMQRVDEEWQKKKERVQGF